MIFLGSCRQASSQRKKREDTGRSKCTRAGMGKALVFGVPRKEAFPLLRFLRNFCPGRSTSAQARSNSRMPVPEIS